MTSATERLRVLLDERGVEWWQSANTLGCVFTRWHSSLFGDEVVAMENGKEGLVLFDHFMTPEQAIAATLWPGTCEVVSSTLHEYEGGYAGSEWEHELSCGDTVWWGNGDAPEWCPWCGRKVVG